MAYRLRVDASCIALLLLLLLLHTARAFELSSSGHHVTERGSEEEVTSSSDGYSPYGDSREDDDESKDDEEENGPRMLGAFGEWMRSRRRDPYIPRRNKWSPYKKSGVAKRGSSCMMKCLSQGYLHPAQCHSLC